jgi:hypothetical protein
MVRPLLIVASLALASSVASAANKKKQASADLPLVESVFRVNEAPVSARGRIFLIAGSAETAAFSQEIVDQRATWLAVGFQPDEIECYYPVPYQEDLIADSKHYLALAPELERCHRVSVATLREHLQSVATQQPRPPFIYVYITSHGDKPVADTLREARPTDTDYWALRRTARYPVFDQYRIVIEGMKDGTASEAELLGALRAGSSADELYLTPGNLQRMLASFEAVPKFVVLQACHSGGFVEQPSTDAPETLLSQLPAVTVLTAARHDRSSFGCEPRAVTTFYGGIFNEELRKVAASPLTIDWKRLSETVAKRVEALEKQQRVSPPSLPQFFTSPLQADSTSTVPSPAPPPSPDAPGRAAPPRRAE